MGLFEHPDIQHYEFENVPLDRDIYLMDEKWLVEFEAAMIRSFSTSGTAYSVGYYSYAAARKAGPGTLEMTWYPNVYDRFHSVEIFLPQAAFVLCVGSWQHDYKPIVFVRSDWLKNLHHRSYSAFALVDAIGVKNALSSGALTSSKLIDLR